MTPAVSNDLALTPIPERRPNCKLDVVFVHGLGDNPANAWQSWPDWLAKEFADIQIWMLHYGAAKFWYQTGAMALPDRANSVLAYLIDNQLGQRDLLFVTHSLGGLVVKQMLATSKTHAVRRWEPIAGATRGIVFLATPHTGTNVANIASCLGIASNIVTGLQNDDPWLRWLNDWYRNNAPKLGWQTRAFFEMRKTKGVLVVSKSSADPHVDGVDAIAVDADHISICKPSSEEAPVYTAVKALTQDCLTARPATASPRLGTTYFAIPPLPENYVERAGALGTLREAVTADRTGRNIAMIAVQGMGGLGKTILAQALCCDEVVQQAFPDGVVWITVGKEPRDDVAARLREVGKALGDDPAAYDGERAAPNRYKSVIRDKAALIVLDDVWSVWDIDPFRAESPRSRLLFTTRDAGIAAGTGAQPLTPDFLSPDESRTMLASWSGTSVDAMPPGAHELIRECGGLALPVATIGARLRDKPLPLWDVVLNQLRKADLGKLRQQFPDYPYPDVLGALQVSVDALELKTRERYLMLAVMLEDMPIHPLIQRVLWNADEFDALETADEFVRLALAQRVGDDGSIRLHDLLLDYTRAQYPDREALGLIHGAIRLSSHVIERDPTQFASQLVGRLLPYMGTPAVRDFSQAVIRAAPRPWLRPLKPALQPPGTGLRSTLEGHTARVSAVAVTPDSRRAVSASDDNTLKVWDLESGRELRALRGHTDSVRAVAITPDGGRAVSASADDTLKVWELESGRELRTLSGHTDWVNAVAVTPDGVRAVSASSDGTLKVWDLESGRELQNLRGHAISVLAVTLDGRRAVSASFDHTLKVWDLESGHELQTLRGHTDSVCAVAVTPDGRRAVSASWDHALKVWDLESGHELQTLQRDASEVSVLAVTSDGRYAVSASGLTVVSSEHTLKVWEIESGRELQTLEGGHENYFRAVALTPDGRCAVSGFKDGTLKVWELESGRELQTLQRDASSVYVVAVTPDGRRAVSASSDHALKVWELESGRELPIIEGHTNSVCAVAVTPDGRRALSASHDNALKVWDLKSCRELQRLRRHDVHVVAVTPDGRRAISASVSGRTMKVWELESGRELQTLEGHANEVNAVVVTPDGRRAVSASADTTLKVWELESGRELQTLRGHTSRHTGDVHGVAVTPDGGRAVSASFDHTLKVWELESGRELQTLEGHARPVLAVAVTPDGRRAVSASLDATLKVWELGSGRELQTLRGHTDSVNAVAVTPDGRRAVSASDDTTLRVWELESGSELQTLRGHTDSVCAVAVTADGRRAVSASADNTLKVWEIESGRELHTLGGHTEWVRAVAVTADGRRAVSASADNTLKVWEIESGRELQTLRGHDGAVWAVVVTPDDRRAVSASADHTLKVWELESGRELQTLRVHTDTVAAVTVTPDGRHVVSASADGTLKVWELESGRELQTFQGHAGWVNAVAVTPDGRRAVSASADDTLKVWELESGRELQTLRGHTSSSTDDVHDVAVTPDGRRAVSASDDNTLKVWEIESGRQLQTLRGHTGPVWAVAVTQDGRRAVSASADTTLKVWELESGREMQTLRGHTGTVAAVAVTPDGQRAVSASLDKTVKVWELKSGATIAIATFSCDASAHCCTLANDWTIVAGDRGGGVYILVLETAPLTPTPPSEKSQGASNVVTAGKLTRGPYDFFLAHARADAAEAEQLFGFLSREHRVFLDAKTLEPGDIWDIEIPRAQQASDVTVVLISSKSEAAYYEREEIAAAIDLLRKDASQHRIVPIYLDRAAHERGEIPYGLRRIHGIFIDDVGSLKQAADHLVSMLTRANN